jgi:hypothetical protein
VRRTSVESRKKQYVTPELVAYGDVREITQSAVEMGMTDDGATKGNAKSAE